MGLFLLLALAQYHVAIGTIGKVRDHNFLVPKRTTWTVGTPGASSTFTGGENRNLLQHHMASHLHLVHGAKDKNGNRLLGRLSRLHPHAPLVFVTGSSSPEASFPISAPVKNQLVSFKTVKSASFVANQQTEECSVEVDAAVQCIDRTSSGQACLDCLTSVNEGLPEEYTCTMYMDVMCSGIETCGCSPCEGELETYFSCSAKEVCGLLTCGGDPDEPPSTSEPADDCNAQTNTVNQCVSSMSSGQACADCMNSVFAGLPTGEMTCTFYQDQICSGIDSCGCTACQDELEDLSSCGVSYQCGSIDCSIDDCSAELDAVNQCVSTTCADCINAAHEGELSDTQTCLKFETELCSAIDTCGCAACLGVLENLYSCVDKDICGELDCSSNSQFDECQDESNIVSDCLTSTFVNCTNDAIEYLFDNDYSITCSDYETAICSAINTGCCGTCSQANLNVSACSSSR
jgi:hypothetical protein